MTGRSLRRVRGQMRNWRVCQKCGRVISADQADADGWLVAPYCSDPSLMVVRCYAHITDSALRISFAGRTHTWRQKMKEGRDRAASEQRLHPGLEPFPMEDRWED